MVSDTAACAAWAAIYSVIGSLGGSVTSNPAWSMAIAVAIAVSMSAVVHRELPPLTRWDRTQVAATSP